MGSHPADRFGRNLLQRRKRVGLSQEELAELTELHRVDIGVIERGELQASPCELLAGLRWRAGYYVQGEFYVEEDTPTSGNGADST